MPTYKVVWSVKKYLDTIPNPENIDPVENAETFAADNRDCYVINLQEYYSEFYVWLKAGNSEKEVIENLKPKNSVMLEIYKVSDEVKDEFPLLDEFVKRQPYSKPNREVEFLKE